MHSPVVFRCARAMHRRDIATLRFNFRGVGRSAGVHDEGRGEKEDVRAALTALCERVPDVPVTLAGYSFGSRVGFEAVLDDPRVDWLVGIGIPVALGSYGFLEGIAKRVLLVQGDRDEFGEIPALERLIRRIGPRSSLRIVPGADHLFNGELGKLEEILYAALEE
jgi:alpha/beta superfamily hydrolase